MNRYIFMALVGLVASVGLAQDGEPTESSASSLLGDYRDGSQSQPVHHLPLYDAQGFRIFPGMNDNQPFSLRITCGQCHDVDTVGSGWHFSTAQVEGNGRPGEPWIYWDAGLATQIPLSLRPWPGTFEPNQIGLSDWWFIQAFGRHMPGGQVPMPGPDETPDPEDRWDRSGGLEINCLACHNGDPTHEQGKASEQIGLQNFAWVPTSTCEFAHVTGNVRRQARTWEDGPVGRDGPQVTYDESRFFAENQVFMDIRRHVPNSRCLFCHSSTAVPGHGINQDQDVHLGAGMACVDCHRHGLDHAMVRGYEQEALDTNEPERFALSCKGCHMGTDDKDAPTAGRLTAPYPEHKGMPTIHFEKLSCTACHTGPWPGDETEAVKTSRAHALGTHQINRTDDTLPHIQTPVFAVDTDGKIAPHHLVWPAYWGWLQGEAVSPVAVDLVRNAVSGILPRGYELTSANWPEMTNEQVGAVLTKLATKAPAGSEAVYISGGKMHHSHDGHMHAEDHPAAAPVMWPVGHDVRPAEQSLGVRSCKDCHATDAGMLFGEILVDGPLVDPNERIAMAQFHGLDPLVTKLFAQSFVFRPWMKVVSTLACLLVLGVLAVFALRALHSVSQGTVEIMGRD